MGAQPAEQPQRSIIDAALAYADRGYRVFPCRPTDKSPYTTNGFHDATTDPDQVERWWAENPAALIGLVCDGWWALDTDKRHGGEESLSEILQDRRIDTARNSTPGGSHFLFRGRGPKQGVNVNGWPGLDVRSNGKGYIIAPPSVRADGGEYVCDIDLDEMIEAPDWFVEALGGLERETPETGEAAPRPDRPNLLTALDRRMLASALPEISSDNYQTWIDIGMALESTGAEEEAFQIWLWWSEGSAKFRGEWDCRRKWRTFRGALNEIRLGTVFHHAKEAGWEWEDPKPVKPESGESEHPSSPLLGDGSLGLSRDQLFSPPAPREYLLSHPDGRGFYPMSKAGMLSSAGSTGKTFAMVELALAIAAGKKWLDHFLIDPSIHSRVLLVLAEEGPLSVHEKLYASAKALGLTDAEREHALSRITVRTLYRKGGTPLLTVDKAGNPQETEHAHALRQLLNSIPEGEGWALVVLDPLARLAGVEAESNNTLATKFVEFCEALTDAPGRPSVLVCAHSSKAARRMGGVDSRGVTGLPDAFRFHATIKTDKGDKNLITLEIEQNNLSPPSEPIKLVRRKGGALTVETAAEEEERKEREEKKRAAKEEKEDTKIDALVPKVVDAITVTPGLSTNDIESLGGARAVWLKGAALRAEQHGKVHRRKEGSARRWYPGKTGGLL